MKMKFPDSSATAPRGRCESDFEVDLARAEVYSSRWREHFSLSTHTRVLPSYSSASSSGSFPFPLSLLSSARPLVFGLTRISDNIEKDFAHVLSNRKIIARILKVKYTFKMKRRAIGFIFRLTDLARR